MRNSAPSRKKPVRNRTPQTRNDLSLRNLLPGCVRRTSSTQIFGLPLWQIAQGPDLEQGELYGKARAVFAVGDQADGVFALGGIARGVVAVGGVSIGGFALGGVAIGLVGAVGGVAASAVTALGGVAVAPKAKGGAVIGGTPSRAQRVVSFLRRL